MKKLFLFLVISFTCLSAFSQKVYFVYLQSEPQQPFTTRVNGKLYSSSTAGYLILPKLIDSTYSLKVSFSDNKIPEQTFSITINKKDRGYLLKDFGDKGWGLFDLQTMTVQNSGGGSSYKAPEIKYDKEVSDFTNVLSRVADDPGLKEKTPLPVEEKKVEAVVKTDPPKTPDSTEVSAGKEEKKPEEVVKIDIPKTEEKKAVEVVKTDPPMTEEKKSEVVVKIDPPQTEEKKVEENKIPASIDISAGNEEKKAVVDTVEPIKNEDPVTEFKRSVITRKSESSTTEGFGLVFTDDNGEGRIDTIRLIIPEPKIVVSLIKEEPKEEKKFLEISPADTVKIAQTMEVVAENIEIIEEKKDPPRAEEKKAPVVDVKAPVVETKTEIKDTVQKKAEPVIENTIPATEKTIPVANKTDSVVSANKNCNAQASQEDFFKLRKNMAAVPFDDDMINVAKKVFRAKCFTTLQVKNLGHLFLDDEGKYKFYDAAYAYVSDPGSYSILQKELKEEYYIKRFNAMLR